ncbi:MAG: sulfatase [Planctomycetota bacterium]
MLLALAGALGSSRGCGSRPAVPTDRIIDLVGLLRDAEWQTVPGGDHAILMEKRRAITFDEDVVFVPAPAPTRYTYRGITIPPGARLVHRAGRNPLAEPSDAREVTFSATILRPGQGPALLFSRRTSPRDFPDGALYTEEAVDLAPFAGEEVDLELACEPVRAPDAPIYWCGFYSPRIESNGREVPADEDFTRTRKLAYSFYQNLASARSSRAAATPQLGASTGQLMANGLAGGTRPSIVMFPDDTVTFRVDAPEVCELVFGFGAALNDLGNFHGELKLRVVVDGRSVHEQVIRPGDDPAELCFHDANVLLPRRRGTREIAFECTRTPVEGPQVRVGIAGARLLALESTPALSAEDRTRNVVVILIDTLRADHVSSYGYPRPTTPHIDRVARDGLRYERAISSASWTTPATASIFTARDPYAHGVIDETSHYLADDLVTLAEVFAAAGYTTGAFVANPLLSWTANFDQGFQLYDLLPLANARGTLKHAIDWIASVKERRFFAYVHLIDPHSAYRAPGKHADRFLNDPWRPVYQGDQGLTPLQRDTLEKQRRLYDAEIAYADDQIGRFMGELEQLGLARDCVLLITSDHGEEFNEHGGLEHGHTLYEELIHVPLVLRGPGVTPGVLPAPVQTMRIAPTLVRLAGLDVDPWQVDALPLGPSERIDPSSLVSFASTHMPTFNRVEDAPRQFKDAIRTERYKYIWTTSRDGVGAELYDLDRDPGEQHDIKGDHPDVAERLRSQLQAWDEQARRIAPDVRSDAQDPSYIQKLNGIGYIKLPSRK